MPLHPYIQRVLERVYERGHANLPSQPINEVRQYYQRHSLPQLNDAGFEDIAVHPGVTIRLHRPFATTQKLPIILYFRASAYVLGSIADTDYFCHHLAQHMQCLVAVIEPRLAPEYKFPIPFNDALRCIEYLYHYHQQLGIDLKKVALWGESSGANMVAAIAQQLKATQPDLIRQQILFYPMLDYHQHHLYRSKVLFGKGYMMDNLLTDWFLEHYVQQTSDFQDVRVSPLLADDFNHLPETLLICAQYDPMRDEANTYFDNLNKSGVSAKGLCMPGMIHGFLSFTAKIEEARFAQYYAAAMLKEKFA